MKITEEKEIILNKIIAIQCDKCKKEYDIEKDILEIQEFHHIHFVGGYASSFGDTSVVDCDICQHCLYDLISSFAIVDYADWVEYKFKEIE